MENLTFNLEAAIEEKRKVTCEEHWAQNTEFVVSTCINYLELIHTPTGSYCAGDIPKEHREVPGIRKKIIDALFKELAALLEKELDL